MQVSDRNIKRFKRAVKQLDKVILDCGKELPGCKAYLDAGYTLHLMDGTVDIGDEGDHESVIAYEKLTAGGGDW